MRQVVKLEEKHEIVDVNDVNATKYYGVINIDTEKGFIAKGKMCDLEFNLMARKEITIGNCWSHFKNANLKKMCENLIIANFKIFEFDTPKELFAWLAE